MSEKKPFDCECRLWGGKFAFWQMNLHHPECEKYDSKEAIDLLLKIIEKLVIGIEDFGMQIDGIPGEVWDAYKEGRMMCGHPIIATEEAMASDDFEFTLMSEIIRENKRQNN